MDPKKNKVYLDGPLTLLREINMSHNVKMMFRLAYGHLLLLGKDLPVSPYMSMAGKYHL